MKTVKWLRYESMKHISMDFENELNFIERIDRLFGKRIGFHKNELDVLDSYF